MDETLSKTKKKILETALTLFKQKGYENVSIAEICEAAGISTSTFYYQFTSKNVLFSYLSHRDIALPAEVTIKMLTVSSPLEKLWLLHLSYANLGEHLGPDLYGQLIKNRITQQLSYEADEDYVYSVSLAAAFIESAQKLGEIRNMTPARDLSETVLRLLVGISHFWCVEKGSYSLRERMRQDLEAFYDVRPDLRTPKK
jgi:AcrR family transcriptional regulator